MTRGSRLRSFLHPTRMMGRPAQKCMTSEIHWELGQHTRTAATSARERRRRTFSWTLSSESGESTAKQMRMTSLSGYESGRNLEKDARRVST